MPQLMPDNTNHLILVEPGNERIIQYDPLIRPKAIEVRIRVGTPQTAIHNIDLPERKIDLAGQPEYTVPEGRVFEFFEFIEKRGDKVGVQPAHQQCRRHKEYLDAPVEILAAYFDDAEVDVEDGRHDDERQRSLHDQVVEHQLEGLAGLVVALLDDEGRVDIDGHLEELGFEVLDDEEGQPPLELALRVGEREDVGDVVPDHGHNVAQDEDGIQGHLESQHEHLERELVERVVLRPRELLLRDAQAAHLRRHLLNHVAFHLPAVYVLLECVFQPDQH